MSKSRRIGPDLTTKDWLKYKPYKLFSPYDAYYLKLANTLFTKLNSPQLGLRGTIAREHIQEIALIATCHFEDFINEIGIWPAVLRKHQELYGAALPILYLEGYEQDYLNAHDFSYLIWHQLTKLSNKTIHPLSNPVLSAGELCYEFFEPKIDEALTTDFYDEWLSLEDDISYFEFRERLQWLAFHSYLLRPDLSMTLDEKVHNLAGDEPDLEKKQVLITAAVENTSFQQASSWCALNAPEWAAEIFRCSDKLREEIRNTSRRVFGFFLFEGADERYYHFQFLNTKRRFPVLRESVELNLSRMTAGDTLGYFSLAPWGGEWWLSGSYLPYGSLKERSSPLKSQSNFYGWSEEEQAKLLKQMEETEASFLHYFGAPIAFFATKEKAKAALQSFGEWLNTPTEKILDPKESPLASGLLNPAQVTWQSGGVWFHSNVGPAMASPAMMRIVSLLHEEEEEEIRNQSSQLFQLFFTMLPPSLAFYFYEHYPMDNLQFDVFDCDDLVKENFELFLRFYNPNGFKQQTLRMELGEG